MSGLPAFPEIADTQGGRVVDGVDYGFDLDAATIAILSARAEAWEARCRKAVEALREVNCSESTKIAGLEMNYAMAVECAREALKAIGPLPP